MTDDPRTVPAALDRLARQLPDHPALVTDERYAEAARDVRLFLEGRRHDLSRSLKERMEKASEEQRYEEAGGYRDLLRTLEEMEERQKIAAAEGDDALA